MGQIQGGGGGVRGQKQVSVPKIGLKFPDPLINFGDIQACRPASRGSPVGVVLDPAVAQLRPDCVLAVVDSSLSQYSDFVPSVLNTMPSSLSARSPSAMNMSASHFLAKLNLSLFLRAGSWEPVGIGP